MPGFDVRAANLRALNSLTKYPSIPTYHQLDPRNGILTEQATAFDGPVLLTEKIDGTNARIVLLPPGGGYLLGSRENLLYASGDLIGDPALGIVEHLRPVADAMPGNAGAEDGDTALVFYLELYGGKIGGQAKQYSTKGAHGWRLFDIAVIDNLVDKLTWAPERISAWRDSGGQTFCDEEGLTAQMQASGLDMAPRLYAPLEASQIPASVEGMHGFLKDWLPETTVALDDSGQGRPEGIVLRTQDRSVIAKARFQDYERTLKRRAKAAA